MRTPSLIASALCLATAHAPALQVTSAADTAPAPASIEWDAVSSVAYDLRWRLPETPGGAERDLVTKLTRLIERRYDAPDDLPWAACFGDVVRELRDLSPRARERRLSTLRERAPQLWRDMGPTLADLLADEDIGTEDWEPSRRSDTDGVVEGPVLDAEEFGGTPWSELDGSTKMYQVGTLVHADLASIKAAENDFDSYYTRRHADYEEVRRVDGSYRVGKTPGGGPFAVIKVYFRCDLPWPFGGYDGVLHGISLLDDDDRLFTDFYVTSDDFYWMAGRDTCLPVYGSDGEWVTMILIRQAGFDLSGVPDGSDERVGSSRGVIGNVKVRAEEIDDERSGPPLVTGEIPAVRF